jgi:hypothetical protein
MSGKFTRLKYDQQAYDKDLYQSTCPLIYKLDPNYTTNCNNYLAPYNPSGGCNKNKFGEQIDIDSVLKGIAKNNSKVDTLQPNPFMLSNNSFNNNVNILEPHFSRFSHPTYELKEKPVRDMNFSYPLFDPQCQIFENYCVNTRLQAKDNHRAIWQIPFDQKDLLPRERLGKVKTNFTINNGNYAPYHPYQQQ